MVRIAKGAMVALALWVATSADATVFRFKMTGAYNADFTVDTADPHADLHFFNPYIVLYGTGSFGGTARGNVELVLYSAGSQGLDVYIPNGVLEFDGPMLYNFPWSGRPVIVPQSFQLFDYDERAVQLVISDPSVAVPTVPEPATWAMMMAGFGAIGIGLRQRRRMRLVCADEVKYRAFSKVLSGIFAWIPPVAVKFDSLNT